WSCSSLLFFFSSRRRHTRFSRDWSSDVCSSDLLHHLLGNAFEKLGLRLDERFERRVAADESGEARAKALERLGHELESRVLGEELLSARDDLAALDARKRRQIGGGALPELRERPRLLAHGREASGRGDGRRRGLVASLRAVGLHLGRRGRSLVAGLLGGRFGGGGLVAGLRLGGDGGEDG